MNYDPLQNTVHATTAWSPRSWSFDRLVRTGDVITVPSRPLARPVSNRPVENRDVWQRVDSKAVVRLEGVCYLKFPVTTSEFETVTFRPVVQSSQPMAPPRVSCFSNIPIHCSVSFLIILSNVYKYCTRFLYIPFCWTTLSQIHDL